jgi:demethylmenaquinone methyltransferase/2-methoxy-6-polyprenyl-1,4-benzoquinol methylase
MNLTGKDKRKFVQEKFAAVSERYDLLNSLLSLYVDHYWRWKATRELKEYKKGPFLDLCAGTLPLSVEVARQKKHHVFALDFCHDMLLKGKKNIRNKNEAPFIFPVCADAEELCLSDNIFQGITVAFGVRNLTRLEKGLKEMMRVLAPGGKLVILEFSRPSVPFLSNLYRFYLHKVLPMIGGIISGDSHAYQYLAESIKEFHEPAQLKKMMTRAGFKNVRHKPLTSGIVTLYTGVKAY